MRTISRRRTAAGAASAVALALMAGACGGGSGGGGDEGAPVDVDELLSGDEHSVGAMQDYAFGDTFVASSDEPLTISMLYRDHPNYPLDENWLILQQLQDVNNVVFDFTSVPLPDLDQRRSVLVGAGNAPDVMPNTKPSEEQPFIASGSLLPISDYVDLMPNFQHYVEEWGLEDEIEAQRKLDGKYYMIPSLLEAPRDSNSITIRADLFEASGFDEDPQTWDEFADQLEKVMADNDLQYGFSDRWNFGEPMGATLGFAGPSFGTDAGWEYHDGLHWDDEAGEYVYAGAQDEYRDMLAYFNDMYERGLLDPESLSQDDETAMAKFASGQSAAIGSNDQEILLYRNAMNDPNARLRQIVVPAGPAGDIVGSSRISTGLMFSSDLADKDTLVATLQFADWLYYSDEGREFAMWGVEGKTFTRDGDTRVLADDIDMAGLNPDAPQSIQAAYGFYNGVFMLEHGSSMELMQSERREEVAQWFAEMDERKTLRPTAPALLYDELELEQQALTGSQLKDTVMQYTSQFILGQASLEDDWDDYVAQLESQNMQAYVDLANEATQREFDEDAFG
ncbi:extracellular solute-binding protein [Jiangella mangrovi]|uniref:Putative aldouronate transport system substrate-binding protein n=1 Tax=Jiangella mangrovi TaxID=1524084 RepID=A0A7W9GWN6_9ACTN|nr:extracellular solute-binding protein [Jiangella mangrovi]MBB5791046.1 putative aldouronate transport system substrate-binding protein [Jiangella mangrovi]